MKINFQKILNYFLVLINLISISGSLVYRVYQFNALGISISLIMVMIGLFFYGYLDYKNSKNQKVSDHRLPLTNKENSLVNYFLLFFYFLFYCLSIYILLKNRTVTAIISPWQILPFYFFISYILATIALILNIFINKKLSILLISLHYLLSFFVALAIYKIGYGYDPFIHQATVDLINKKGFVEPKPFYYLGQYSLEIIINKLSFISLVQIDKFLVPLLAGLTLPFAFYRVLAKWFNDNAKINLTILLLLAIPFTIFIVTTPQNLAYLFLLLAILLGITCQNLTDLILIYLLASAAMAAQVIAGIPAILFAVIITIYHSDLKNIKKYFYSFIYFLTAISLPLSFYILERGQKITSAVLDNGESVENITASSVGNIKNILSWFYFKNPGQENIILNFVYLYAFNLKTILLLLSIAGIIVIIKYRRQCRIFCLYIGMSISLIISYLLTSFLPFNFLISYERSNYTDRIMVISILFLIPLFLITFYGFIDKILKQNKFIKISILSFFVLLITTSLYISYPRFDHYYNSHGYAVSQNDIEAVRWINDNTDKDYIVLANQQVSVAALREFGFNKYYKITPSPYQGEGGGEVFYYPIPTGGPLYQYYLDMVYKKPDKETIKKAMELAGVNEGYFVLNKYWWAFPKILDEAKLEADSWKEIGNGEIFIFKYVR